MKPIEFYKLGTTFAPAASSEAERRMVVGRIYYGLHHEACCRFFRKNPNRQFLDRRGRHAALVDVFNGSRGDADALLVGKHLGTLKMLRESADYELGPFRYATRQVDSLAYMNFAVQLGNLLLNALDSYSPGEALDGCICVK